MLRSALLLLALVSACAAAVGPDSTAVVINGDHADGEAVARRWMELRRVPAANAVVLRGLPAGRRMPLAEFRTRILAAVEAELAARGIAERIAAIAYAPGLPTKIDFEAPEGAPRGQLGPGAITGMTLLAPILDQPPPRFTFLHANPYAGGGQVPGEQLARAAAADPAYRLAQLAMLAKDAANALRLLREVAERHPAPDVLYNLACYQALAGELDEAAATLGRALDAGWVDAEHMGRDPDLAELRKRPDWGAQVERARANEALILAPDSPGFAPIRRFPGMAADAAVPGRVAMLLADLGEGGETRAEAEARLARSAAADGDAPTETVWLMLSADAVRTGPRRWAYAAARRGLADLGIRAEIASGALPPRDAAVAGLTTGIATFDWPGSGARLLPGAWCDHLTSCGGMIGDRTGQTTLVEFLRGGAAGAGGTVAEPLAHHQKFPDAFVHLHRARGLSLVEAVHRSLKGPYQYLAVGDPLSRPWPARQP